MESQKTRRNFLKFFKERGHTVVPSSPVIPHEDPTLLFTNAGMNQFKDIFLGKSERDYKRAASSQKCIRAGGKHNDLENVGHTSRHLTFFEMLGNFSFGDYFKKEAIAFAWELTSSVFEFDPERLFATVFEEDEESFELWKSYLPQERIVRMGEADNFWAMGDSGPCGPCSELYYDRGPSFGEGKNPAQDSSGERFLEFWNLVFMQFNKSHDKLETLPSPCVDTGSGLERVVSLKMGVDSLFETDILRGLIAEVERLSRKRYDPLDQESAPSFRVIADHIRTLSFAINDGAQPSNVDRGYVLRKILRRAVRYGRNLGFETPFLASLLPRLIELMGEDYPDLKGAQGRIAEILTLEEENFFRTLRRGGGMMSAITHASQKTGVISGEDAFKLKDTYGLPLDEIVLFAKDAHLEVDLVAFDAFEKEAKIRSRSAHKEESQKFSSHELFHLYLSAHGPTLFTGYEGMQGMSEVTSLLKDDRPVERLEKGESGSILLKATPFYAEKGGQVGDQGEIRGPTGSFHVTGCLTPYPGIVLHQGSVTLGVLERGDKVSANVDAHARNDIARHHSATHLLHLALQKVLGPHDITRGLHSLFLLRDITWHHFPRGEF